jgi:hypothetical protein
MAGKNAKASGSGKSPNTPDSINKLQDARDKYIKELEAENALLQAQLEERGAILAKEDIDFEEEVFDVSPNDYVKVMSLLPHRLNLCTKERGQGNVYKFDTLFQTKRIMYKDLADILEVNRKFLEMGYFCILNKKVVRLNGLDDIQNKNLDKEKIEQVFSGTDEGLSLYASASESQQKVIIDTLIEKMINDPNSVDLNTVDKISRMSKINLSQKAEDGRLLLKPENAIE